MTVQKLRFLADESCDYELVRCLRAAGYDVLAVAEVTSRSVDREVIAQAEREDRILLTEDKDFGWLVFASHVASPGVVLIRFPSAHRAALGAFVLEFIREQPEALPRAFVVVQPGQVRIHHQPT